MMNELDRRSFLQSAIGGASFLSASLPLIGQARSLVSADDTRPEILFLTWQRDPTTTMTVQWIVESDSNEASVAFAELREGAVSQSVKAIPRPYPETNLRILRAELTDLKPGTEYRFQLNGKGSFFRFQTMPAKATDSFQFISGGDCDINAHAIANNILAAKQDPMFTLIGGDLAYDNGVSVERSLSFLRNYSQHMIDSQGRLIPLVACLGNHEVKKGYGAKREESPFFLAVHDGLYADRTFATLDFGDYLSLILLDTGHIAPIEGEQTAWLEKVLAPRIELPHVFAVNHVPAYPSFRKFEATGGKAGTGELNRVHWVPLFEKYNVDIVLEHHDHTFKRTHPLKDGLVNKQGILYLGDGSWGKLRAPASPEKRPYLAKTSESYHLSLHRLEGNERFHLALREDGKVVDIVRSSKRPRRAVGRSA